MKLYHCNEWHNEYTEFYLKSEADKVIAEKDKKIDLYKRGWEESDRINEHLYAQLRRSNHTRCLAMARWCASRAVVWDIDGNEKKSEWYWKWKERWKKLAKKFKEAK